MTDYLYFDGTAGSYASTPDAAPLDITGDIDIRAKMKFDDWEAAQGCPIGKWEVGANAYGLRLQGSPTYWELLWYDSAQKDERATSHPSFGPGEEGWIRATLDVDNGAGGYTVTFYESDDGVSWTQFDQVVTASGTTSIDSTSSLIRLGALRTFDVFAGGLYQVQLYDGIDGTIVFAKDFTTLTDAELAAGEFTEDSSNAATVTLNGDAWAYTRLKTTIAGKTPELYLDASVHVDGIPKWSDRSGNDHHAQFGSAAGADTNDPTFLAYDGDKYVWLPGSSSNYLSTPDAAPLEIAGDLDVRVKVSLPGLTVNTGLCSKWFSPDKNWAFEFYSTGFLGFAYSVDGTTTVLKQSTVTLTAAGIPTDTPIYLRVTHDVDNGASGSDVAFYWSTNGSDWTQIGATVTTAGTVTRHTGSAAVVVAGGSTAGATFPPLASFYEMSVRNGVDGTLALDVNLADAEEPYATFTERSSNAATVTINRAASGYLSTVVDRDMFVLSTDDYFEVADHADLDFGVGESFTILVAHTLHPIYSSYRRLVEKRSAGAVGYSWTTALGTNDMSSYWGDGGNSEGLNPTATAVTPYVHVVTGMVRDGGVDGTVFIDGVFEDMGADGTGDLSNSTLLYIGKADGVLAAGTVWEGSIVAVALFREALTDEEILSVSEALSASWNVSEAFWLHGDALWDWMLQQDGIVAALSTTDTELVGALNELNSTEGIEYAEARGTFLDIPPAG